MRERSWISNRRATPKKSFAWRARVHRRRRADRRRQDEPREAARAELRERADPRAGRGEPVSRALLSQSRARSALPTQLFFLFQRARQIEQIRQRDMFSPVRIADFLLQKDRLFAELNLDPNELALYKQVARDARARPADARSRRLLAGARAVLLRRVAKRGIAYEQLIEQELSRAARRRLCAVLPRFRRGAAADRERGRRSTRFTRIRLPGAVADDPARAARAPLLQPGRKHLLTSLDASRRELRACTSSFKQRGMESPPVNVSHAARDEASARADRVPHRLRRELRAARRSSPAPTSCWSAIRSAW